MNIIRPISWFVESYFPDRCCCTPFFYDTASFMADENTLKDVTTCWKNVETDSTEIDQWSPLDGDNLVKVLPGNPGHFRSMEQQSLPP